MKRRKPALLLILGILLVAGAACNSADREDRITELPPEPEEGVLVYAALNPVSNGLQASVDSFNSSHEDAQIEIRDYSDEGGPQRLLVELVAGRVPDIMELHQFGPGGESDPFSGSKAYGVPLTTDPAADEYWMPYRQMVQRGYLEDLWPYIENDPDIGREGVVEAPLRAAEVNGGLYMLFNEVRITTLMGPERIVGDRYSWTFQELMDAFSDMPEDSTILRYNSTKWDVFSRLLCFSLNQYVDWDAGKCFFDHQEFRSMLEFLNTFPTEFETSLEPEQVEEEIIRRLKSGRQMLEGTVVAWMRDITYKDAFWKEPAAFIGYPTADGGSGSLFNLRGTILAMSATCQNKEAAWDYMRQFAVQRYNRSSMAAAHKMGEINLPINRTDYELANQVDLARGREVDLTKDPEAMPPWRPFSSDMLEIFPMDPPAEEDIQRLDQLVNATTQIYWPDSELSNIVWEAIGPYFAGDKSLDDTVALVQNRVSLYVNEQR